MQKRYIEIFKSYNFKLVLISGLFLLASFSGLFSQGVGKPFFRDWEISANVGMTSFYGDVTDKKNRFFANTPFHKYFYDDRGLGYGIMIEKNMNNSLSLRGFLMHGNIISHFSEEQIYFDAVLNEYYFGASYDISNLIWGEKRNQDWELYGFFGIGFTDYRSWLYDMKTDKLLDRTGFGAERWLDGKDKMATETTIPFGIGFSYRFKYGLSVAFETGIHGLNTDILDSYKSDDASAEGFGYTSLALSYSFNFPSSLGGYPNYRGKSSDPAIKEYNKRKSVIMRTKAQRKASRKRYKPPNERNIFERFIYLFKKKRYKNKKY